MSENKYENIVILKKETIIIILGVIFSFAFGYYLWGYNLKASWHLIDDHEIMRFLGSDEKMLLSELPSKLLSTEVGTWGKTLRFRPAYYFLRLLETCLSGNSPFWWYFTRYLMFCISVMILWRIMQQNIGMIFSIVFVLFVFAFKYWSHIFVRIGPAETYAVFGIALYSFAFMYFYRHIHGKIELKYKWGLGLCMSIGAMVSIGSKENFVLLIIPTIFLLYCGLRKRKMNLVLLINSSVIIGFCLFVGIVIYLALSATGHDIYANDTTTSSRLKILLQGLLQVVTKFKLLVIIPLGVLLGIIIRYKKGKDAFYTYIKVVKKNLILLAVILFIYLSQYVFYNGKWPHNGHYDFPGMLTVPFFYLLILHTLSEVCKIMKISGIYNWGIRIFVITVLFFQFYPMNKYKHLRKVSYENQKFTTELKRTLGGIVEECKAQPDTPILIESLDVWDYEPIWSIRIFLSVKGIENPMYLRLNGYSGNSFTSGRKKILADALQRISENGGWAGYLPLSQLEESNVSYITVKFSGVDVFWAPARMKQHST